MKLRYLLSLTRLFTGICLLLISFPSLSLEKLGIEKIETIEFKPNIQTSSYGYRLYRNSCATCHGEIGLGNVNRAESPRILGIKGQELTDAIIYYRDARQYGIHLTGSALLMSRQVLYLSNDQVLAISTYLDELIQQIETVIPTDQD